MIKTLLLLGAFTLSVFGIDPAYSQEDSLDMSYTEFLNFCKQDTPLLWESMIIQERLVSNLCDSQSEEFGEKQWDWLSGTSLDWNNFAQMASNEYAGTIPEFAENGIRETLRVDSFVSGRDSFPPSMEAMISFDYEKFSQLRHYNEKFTVCIDGKLVPQNNFIECSDEYVTYVLTKEKAHIIPKFIKNNPLPSHTKQQMLDWCQNSPKHVKTSRQFWDVIPVRLLSNTDEFKSFQGIKESFVANSNAVEDTCPPNVWMSGTFESENGESHRFSLFYGGDFFRYQIGEVQCKNDLVVVIKSIDDSYVCVKPETKQKLIQRGWAANGEEHMLDSTNQKVLPKFKILGLNYANHPDEPLIVSIEKIGYETCDSWNAKIIDVSDNSVVWERDYTTSCVVLDPPKQQKFVYMVSSENRPIIISEVGRYVFQITIGGTYLEQEFVVRNNFSGISIDRTIYPTIIVSSPDHDPNPRSIVLQIGVNNTTYWKNESNIPITLTSEDKRWSTGLIPPNEGKVIQFNETAFYKYRGLPSTTINGRIAILSDQTEFLPIPEKLAIAREIIKVDMGNPITGIGIGNADNVLDITIHEDELEKNPNAKEYYKKRYQDMIPFEVPIRIEFGHVEPQ